MEATFGGVTGINVYTGKHGITIVARSDSYDKESNVTSGVDHRIVLNLSDDVAQSSIAEELERAARCIRNNIKENQCPEPTQT